jgi:ribosomal protein S18 acetylase RimI-like enzyme
VLRAQREPATRLKPARGQWQGFDMIRYATKDDASSDTARLVHQTDVVFRFLFGEGETAIFRIQRLIEGERNLLSYRNMAAFEAEPGKVAGVILAYAPALEARGAQNEDFHTVFSGWELFLLWLKSFAIGALDDKSEVDGLYISNVSVSPEARGLGIGAKLIAFAESRAFAEGHASMWLDVAASNVGARRLYERLGFEVNSELRVWCKPGRFLRMRKQIGLPQARA